MSFCALILTHGRPDAVKTHTTLRRGGYTGPLFFVIDNEDQSAARYAELYGDSVVTFDKRVVADAHDEGNNWDDRRCIVHARNASFGIAERLGFSHFVQLDDDYYYFGMRDVGGARKATKLDAVFAAMVEFLDASGALSVAMSQGGDHIGGFAGVRLKRKAMNSFVCATARPFTFLGSLNEDVNTYTRLGSIGGLFFTFTGLQLDQKDTQSQAGGMTDAYRRGTYGKSFSSVLYSPSSVRLSMMGKNARIHHAVDWACATPMIVSAEYRK